MKASDILNKEIIDLSTAQKVGACCNVGVSQKGERVLFLATEGAVVPFDKTKFGQEILCDSQTKSCDALFVLGKTVYADKGKLLGEIVDVNFSKKGKVKSYTTSLAKTFSPQKIAKVFDVVVLKEAKKRTPAKEQTIQIEKHTVGGDFLIGRLCDKDIFFNNELIVKRDTKITANTLAKVKRYGKLLELSLHAQEIKTNLN